MATWAVTRTLQLADPYSSLQLDRKAVKTARSVWAMNRPFAFVTSANDKHSIPAPARSSSDSHDQGKKNSCTEADEHPSYMGDSTSTVTAAAAAAATTHVEVVLMGASNSGKSTLLNKLMGAKLAFTSKTPGHTKMLNFFRGSRNITLVDVPGYGFGSHERQMQLIGDMFLQRQNSTTAACLLVEARRGVKQLDLLALSLLLENNVPVQIVLTKSDRLAPGKLRQAV